MAYDDKNIFARILRGEAPCIKVYEDDATLAIMDVMPQSEGHLLVLPKESAELIYDLSPEAGAAAMAGGVAARPAVEVSAESAAATAQARKRILNRTSVFCFWPERKA